MKLELVPYWRSFWRFWSVKFAMLGALIQTYFLAFPDAAMQAWNMLPPDLKSFVPPDYARGLVLLMFVLSMVSRIVYQPKMEPEVKRAKARVEKEIDEGLDRPNGMQ